MIKNRIVVLLSIMIFLGACHNPFKGVTVRWGDHIGNEQAMLNPESVCHHSRPGRSVAGEILKQFGEDYQIDFSYDPPFPADYGGTRYPVDRLVVYDGAQIGVQEGPGMTAYTNKGWRTVAFFFYKDRLLWFTIAEQTRQKDGSYEWGPYTSPVLANQDVAFKWPDSDCSIKYYQTKVIGASGDDLVNPVVKCPFDKPGYEESLRREGYYEKLDGKFAAPMGPDECPGPK